MKAILRRDRRLVEDEIAELQPGPGQVLVKTLVCGVCGSDLHALHHLEHMVETNRRAGAADNLVDGVEEAAEAIDKGLANALLNCWIAYK